LRPRHAHHLGGFRFDVQTGVFQSAVRSGRLGLGWLGLVAPTKLASTWLPRHGRILTGLDAPWRAREHGTLDLRMAVERARRQFPLRERGAQRASNNPPMAKAMRAHSDGSRSTRRESGTRCRTAAATRQTSGRTPEQPVTNPAFPDPLPRQPVARAPPRAAPPQTTPIGRDEILHDAFVLVLTSNPMRRWRMSGHRIAICRQMIEHASESC